MEVAQLNGIAIIYNDVGDGIPGLLVHSNSFDRTMWHPQTETSLKRSGGTGSSSTFGAMARRRSFRGRYTRRVRVRSATLLDHRRLDAVVLADLSMEG
jgi:hypothetical protein